MAEIGFIVFYLTFFSIITLVGASSGASVDGGDITNVPTFDGGIIDAFLLPFQWIGYFIGLQGLTVFGISGIASTLLSLLFNVPMMYIVVGLARGGK